MNGMTFALAFATFSRNSLPTRADISTPTTRPPLPTMSETCDAVVPVEAPRYSTLSPSLMTSGSSSPLMIAPASLLRKGSQLRYSLPCILRRSSSYTLLPGTRLLVKTLVLPSSRLPLRPRPSITRTLLVISPELSSLLGSRRRWLLILYLDLCQPLLEEARQLPCLGPAVVVDASRDGDLVRERPGDLPPLPLWRHVHRLVLEEYAVLRRPRPGPYRPEEGLLRAQHLYRAGGKPRHPLEPSCPGDEPRPYRGPGDLGDVGGDLVHRGVDRLRELLPFVRGFDGQLSQSHYAPHVLL